MAHGTRTLELWQDRIGTLAIPSSRECIIASVRLVLASRRPAAPSCCAPPAIASTSQPADVDETRPRRRTARRVTSRGWRARRRRARRCGCVRTTIVLGADTVVVVDRDVLGKPDDATRRRGDAAAPVRAATHEVLTGVPSRAAGAQLTAEVARTVVQFTHADRRGDLPGTWPRGEPARQGRRPTRSGAGVAVRRAHRGLVLQCRRAAGRVVVRLLRAVAPGGTCDDSSYA